METDKLIKLAKDNLDKSYSPYSNFKVSCALESVSGKIFTGVNIENASYSATICAERTAIFKAISEGERAFSKMVIAAFKDGKYFEAEPCGVCRQVLSEFVDGDFEIIVAGEDNFKIYKFEDLMPHTFTKESMV